MRVTEAIVVGGGVIGLCISIQLRCRGHDVVVVDQSGVGSGASAGNAGWIVPALSAPVAAPGSMRYGFHHMFQPSGGFSIRPVPSAEMISWGARFAWSTRRRAFEAGRDATARFAREASRSFSDLVAMGLTTTVHRSGMIVAYDSESKAIVDLQSFETLRGEGVAVDPEIIGSASLSDLEPAIGRRARAGIRFPDELYVDPLELVGGLRDLAQNLGVQILEGCEVRRAIEAPHPRVDLVNGESIDGDIIVIAAGAASGKLARDLGYRLPMQAGKGYSVSVQPQVPLRTPIYIPEAKAAITPFGSVVRVAGVMELGATSLGISDRRVQRMTAVSQQFFAEDFVAGTMSPAWAGLRPVTADSLPVIGRVPGTRAAYLATGHAMLGITLGPLTGEVIAAQISGEPQPIAHPFDPERFSRRAAR